MLNQSEPNLILTAHATKLNRPEPNWTEPQTCLAGRNHALSRFSIQFQFFKINFCFFWRSEILFSHLQRVRLPGNNWIGGCIMAEVTTVSIISHMQIGDAESAC